MPRTQIAFAGSTNRPPEGVDRIEGVSNYFIGRDPAKWRRDVPHYAKVRFREVYPGIDALYYTTRDGRLEFDLVAAPGANLSRIKLELTGSPKLDADGDLVVASARIKKPRIFQGSQEITGGFRLDGRIATFEIAKYDATRPILIDPVIEYATYMGGPGYDLAGGIKYDGSGNLWISGSSRAPAQPVLDPFQQAGVGRNQALLLKFSPAKNAILSYTFVGGELGDTTAGDLAIDSAGNAYLTGSTTAVDFPAIRAAQSEYGGGFIDAFAIKISSDGRRVLYSTFIGGRDYDLGRGIAVDAQGSAYVTGLCESDNMPLRNAAYAVPGSGFLAKISPDGSRFVFLTYLGGSIGTLGSGAATGSRVAVDATGNAYVTGFTTAADFPTTKNAFQTKLVAHSAAFVTKFAADGQSVLASTLFGGTTGGTGGNGLAIDSDGSVYLAGSTSAVDLPLRNAIQTVYGGNPAIANSGNAMLAKFSGDLTQLFFATYLGGEKQDDARNVAIDSAGNTYWSGLAMSPDFPTKNSAMPYQKPVAGYGDLVYVAKLTATFQLVYSTLLGAAGSDVFSGGMLVAPNGAVWIAGQTPAPDFPVTSDAYQKEFGGGFADIYLARFSPEDLAASAILTARPISLSFTAPADPQKVQITSASPGAAFTVSSPVPWIRVTPAAGSTPATFTVSVVDSGLSPGLQTGQLQVRLADGTGDILNVPVSLRVFAPAPVLISVQPVSVPINSPQQILEIKGSGFLPSSTAKFGTASPLPTTYIDANTLRVSVDKAFLTALVSLGLTASNPNSRDSNALTFTVGRAAPTFSSASMTNAASYVVQTFAPGTIVTVFGANFGDATNTRVLLNERPAPIIGVTASQLSFSIPSDLIAPAVNIVIEAQGQRSLPITIPLTTSAPALFTSDASGKGPAAAYFQDNIAVLFGTGGGAITDEALPRLQQPVKVFMDGKEATVWFAGPAPGGPVGFLQINAQPPEGVHGIVPIVVMIGDVSSPAGVTLAIP